MGVWGTELLALLQRNSSDLPAMMAEQNPKVGVFRARCFGMNHEGYAFQDFEWEKEKGS
jgi:hypothetical protein